MSKGKGLAKGQEIQSGLGKHLCHILGETLFKGQNYKSKSEVFYPDLTDG